MYLLVFVYVCVYFNFSQYKRLQSRIVTLVPDHQESLETNPANTCKTLQRFTYIPQENRMSLRALNKYPLSFLAVSQQDEHIFYEETYYTPSQKYDIHYFIEYISITLVDNMAVLDWTCKTYFKVELAIFVSCCQCKTSVLSHGYEWLLFHCISCVFISVICKVYCICISSWPAYSVHSRKCDQKRESLLSYQSYQNGIQWGQMWNCCNYFLTLYINLLQI